MTNFFKLFVVLTAIVSLTSAINLTKAIAQRKAVCTLQSSYGSCSGSKVKWHYDFVRDSCIEFIYSSCGGNANRFDTRIACIQYCMDPVNRYRMQDFENEYLKFRENDK
ncbi:kunitz-type serine protease inhibitor Bi-KTI-like [Drosophila nasuta]|uniref:kunitz-type serine protease inhibitor Bi-KTI-like n=1 Tax=Drosophila nasuta TaxID=42062 RepID=UPI00295EDFD2|nr:kunitz-type serine protease inhibitor Bi-KTI-like [Drosophila nasuta]